jgi:hypothetical protein
MADSMSASGFIQSGVTGGRYMGKSNWMESSATSRA